MTEKMSGMFDGEEHWLEPGVYFQDSGATLVIDSWEEGEEEDILSPFESRTQEPILRETSTRTDAMREQFPLRDAEQAWGALSTSLSALAAIMGFQKKQYEHIPPAPKAEIGKVKWSFQTNAPVSERL